MTVDFFQGVVSEYLRADRATFVNTEFLLPLEPGDGPAKGRHSYGDVVAANFRERAVYHKAMSYRRMQEEEARLRREIAELLAKAGKPYKRRFGEPEPKAQENFTDPDSRIMKRGSSGFEQCYNAQIAVDEKERIIVATAVTQSAADVEQLIPVLDEPVETHRRNIMGRLGIHSVADQTRYAIRECLTPLDS